jgi:hypothetical protein
VRTSRTSFARWLPAPAALALTVALGLASGPASAGICYCVYGADDTVLYQASQPPVDMSDDVADQIGRRWPRARLVWFQTDQCPQVLPTALAETAALGGRVDPLRAVDEGARGVELPAPARESTPRTGAPAR